MNLKNKVLALGILCALGLPQAAGAEGFAINEWSAEGVAMGGARMFAEGDAANVAYNPASITKVDGEAFKVSATYLSPHGEYDLYGADGKIDESGKNRVHFGFAPGTYYVKKLNDKDWFGIGAFSRFAMVSEFERGSAVSTNAFVSRLDGVSITPTFAHKFDDKWSAAVGAEINYVRLTMEKNATLTPWAVPTHTKGESYALGWNAAANYAFDEKNEIGVVYRSRIKHSMEADFNAYNITNIGNRNGDAYGEVTLPDSWHIGYNHKFNDKTRVELNAVRTNWSTYDALNINVSGTGVPSFDRVHASPKNWENGWRYAIGVEHKLSDKYTLMAGFAYDESSIPYDGGDFMVPTGNRKTYSIGARYNDKDQTLAIALGWMDVGDLRFKFRDSLDPDGASGRHAHTHDSFTKIIGISYQRNF
mgnify:FL=1